jgi:arylsulfatase A-like enzyme
MNRNPLSRRAFLKIAALGGFTLSNPHLMNKLARWTGDIPSLEKKPNIVVLVFDALSACHMSLYGYLRNTTPNISKFADESTVFQRHYAAGNFTIPNTASLLTGVYPWSHRAFHLYGGLAETYLDKNIFRQLGENTESLAYTHNTQTAYLLYQLHTQINNLYPLDTSAVFDANKASSVFEHDYPRGFDAYRRWKSLISSYSNSLFLRPFMQLSAQSTWIRTMEKYYDAYPLGMVENVEGVHYKLEDTIDWIGRTLESTAEPFFGYIHLLPPHDPYNPDANFLNSFAQSDLEILDKPQHYFTLGKTSDQLSHERQRYDEYIAYVDSEFGRLIENLKKNNILDSTYFIITSDHGELFERGILAHATPTLYNPLLHIPLIIRAPQQAQRKDIFTPTSIIDIMPTVLHLMGQDVAPWCEGQLLPSFGGDEDIERPIFAIEAKENSKFAPIQKATLSITRWPFKLIHYRGYPGYDDISELFDLENDPEELDNLAQREPNIVSDLKKELDNNLAIAEENVFKSTGT